MRMAAKQKRFADEYLKDLNATQAYIRAGYKARGNAATVSSSQLLANAKVQEYIQARMAKREQRTEITQDMVLRELAKIGFADIKDYVSFNGEQITLKPSDGVDGTVISEVKSTPTGVSFKLHDKIAALDKLGRHLGMWNDKLKIDADVTVNKLEDLL